MALKQDYRNVMLFVFGLALLFLFGGFFGYFYSLKERQEFGVIVDISSFNIEFNLYKWANSERIKKTASNVQKRNLVCDINIHKPNLDLNELKENMFMCVRLVTAPLEDFELYNSTIFIYGTELTRLLCKIKEKKCAAIFSVIGEVLESFEMNVFVNQSRSLSGSEEAAYGWISVNENLSTLRNGNLIKYGGLDLKNFSLLISYDVNVTSDLKETSVYEVYGKKYNIATHDLMCYGLTQFYNRVLLDMIMANPTQSLYKHPCHDSTYTFKLNTASLWNPCLSEPQMKLKDTYNFVGELDKTKCWALIDSSINASDKRNNYYLNSLKKNLSSITDKKFIGFSRFSEIANIYNFLSIDLDQFYNSMIKICEIHKRDYTTGCFDVIYSHHLITSTLGILPVNVLIEPQSLIETLTGSIIYNSVLIPPRQSGRLIGSVGFVSVMFSISVFTLFGLFMLKKYRQVDQQCDT